MRNWLKKAWNAMLASYERRATREALRQLDARTLRDIGMESWIDMSRLSGEMRGSK
jgi:uncharacterized protein YjiS (DUF1127 family)